MPAQPVRFSQPEASEPLRTRAVPVSFIRLAWVRADALERVDLAVAEPATSDVLPLAS